MDYKVEYENLCRKIASGGFKEVDRERLQQAGVALLKEDAARAKNAVAALKEEKVKGRRVGSDE